MDEHDALASDLAIGPEEIAKERALWVGARIGNEQFAHKRRLLRCAATIEGKQPFVDEIEVHALGIPTGVEVARFVLRSDKAAIDVGAGTTRFSQQAQRFEHAGQQLPPRRVAEPLEHVLPTGSMFPDWQIDGDGVEVGSHNTTLLLCLE